MSGLELAANTINILSIYLAARNHVLTWLTGIIGCALFGKLFYDVRLYADVSLQVFFVITSLWGWLQWRKRGQKEERLITRIPHRFLLLCAAGGVLTAVAYGTLLQSQTDASLPMVDSLVLAFSVIAQLLLMHRHLETWYFWIVVNIISVPLYLAKGLHLTAAIYALFLGNAIFGLRRWRHEFRGQPA